MKTKVQKKLSISSRFFLRLGTIFGLFLMLSFLGCSLFEVPLVAPSRVSAIRNASIVTLTWQNNSSNALRTVIERAKPTEEYADLVRLTPTSKTYEDQVDRDGLWRYRIRIESASKSIVSSEITLYVSGLASAVNTQSDSGNTIDLSESNWDQTGWSLTWSDEFNSDRLNEDNWVVEIGTGSNGWGNNELQFYRNENISFTQDSNRSVMVITAKAENYSNKQYTSARLKTQGKKSFTYGRIEAALRLPQGQGIWPAFWMLGDSIANLGWPACGEIDIMEMVGGNTATHNDYTTHGTLHYANSAGQWTYVGHKTSLPIRAGIQDIFARDYRLFGVEWTANKITWFLDGTAFHTEDITNTDRTEFHSPHFLLLNLAVGGNWPGSPDTSTTFPQKLYVDWVRVWQKN